MELKYGLEGCLINEIIKNGSQVKLRFSDTVRDRKLTLSFEGPVFETPTVVLNSRVIRTEFISSVGFKARNFLVHQNRNPELYKQLLIVLSGSTADYKSEIICAFMDYQMRAT